MNTTGKNNTASGYAALYNETTGNNNIAVGFQAGNNVTTGNNNIDIGNGGAAADSGFIRIGTKATHTAAFIAGINGSAVTGAAVIVTTGGRLGVASSRVVTRKTFTPSVT